MAQTFIYAIYCPNKQEVKIGYATNPISRLSQLQTGTTDRLDLLMTFAGGLAEEKQIHKALSHHRISGEWFKYSSEVFSVLIEFMSAQFNTKGCETVDLEEIVADLHNENDRLLTLAENSIQIMNFMQDSLIQQKQAWRTVAATFLNIPSNLDDEQFMSRMRGIVEDLQPTTTTTNPSSEI
jgi:hypothetical protein